MVDAAGVGPLAVGSHDSAGARAGHHGLGAFKIKLVIGSIQILCGSFKLYLVVGIMQIRRTVLPVAVVVGRLVDPVPVAAEGGAETEIDVAAVGQAWK